MVAAPNTVRIGLSPRVRGNPVSASVRLLTSGSIPASAGEPVLDHPDDVGVAVYPRECGGTANFHPMRRAVFGLSPRVRGNPYRPHTLGRNFGSIPASAGEPRCMWRTPCSVRVYPRECGGTYTLKGAGSLTDGLSPRVRGNRDTGQRTRTKRRSIPASAGEPSVLPSLSSREKVYPRECGGTTVTAGTGHRRMGLSPRVRGNPCGCPLSFWPLRSIPASAGEP